MKTNWGAILWWIIVLALAWYLRPQLSTWSTAMQQQVIVDDMQDEPAAVVENDDTEEVKVEEPTAEVEEDDGIPAWYKYMQDNGYKGSDVDFSDFDMNELLTRSSVTPYLWQYAKVNEMNKDNANKCDFDDISSLTPDMKTSIDVVCQYGLMRGTNGSFLPESYMKKFELLTVIVRSKVGMLEETKDPWYQVYVDKANELGIIGDEINTTNRNDSVTTKELGQRLYGSSLVE